MSEAYNKPLPNGLSEYNDFLRWRIIGGDTKNWTPYRYDSNYIDQLSLNGLYYLATNNINGAISKWNYIRDISGSWYNGSNQRYEYRKINENYHMGLFEILTSFLLEHSSVSDKKKQELLKHWVSLRSNILSNQEVKSGNFLGWRTGIYDLNTLINTETISVNVLALGAGAMHTFEAGKKPLFMNNKKYFIRPHNVLSAVTGLSSSGHMTFGPYWSYPKGSYRVDFILRAPSPIDKMANIEVYDFKNNKILASKDIYASDMASNNNWKKFSLYFNLENSNNILEFRTYWYGSSNMDISVIRVVRN